MWVEDVQGVKDVGNEVDANAHVPFSASQRVNGFANATSSVRRLSQLFSAVITLSYPSANSGSNERSEKDYGEKGENRPQIKVKVLVPRHTQ